MRSFACAATLAAFALVFTPVTASAVTVGNAVIDRSLNDGFSNFGFAFTDQVFDDGEITEWSAFVGNAGQIGLMVLDQIAANEYEIAQIEFRTVTTGLNTFATSVAVTAGQILGLYQGDGKVDYDLVSGPADARFGANGGLGSAPSVGTSFTIRGSTPRDYSFAAEVSPAPVPLPAGLPLMLAGFGTIVCLRMRKKAA